MNVETTLFLDTHCVIFSHMTKKSANPYWIAQDILSRRDHSESEVRAKLAKKGIAQQIIDDVIAKLQDARLLDDEVYARRYVESILRTKVVGPKWMRAKLKQRGVEDTLISQTLDDLVTKEVERDLLNTAAETWKRSHAKHADDKQRLMRFLASRGFSEHLITEYIF